MYHLGVEPLTYWIGLTKRTGNDKCQLEYRKFVVHKVEVRLGMKYLNVMFIGNEIYG